MSENFFPRTDLYLPELRQLIQVRQARMVTERPGSFCGSLWKYFEPLFRQTEPACMGISEYHIIDISINSELIAQVGFDNLELFLTKKGTWESQFVP